MQRLGLIIENQNQIVPVNDVSHCGLSGYCFIGACIKQSLSECLFTTTVFELLTFSNKQKIEYLFCLGALSQPPSVG